jgi:hypothetical protein
VIKEARIRELLILMFVSNDTGCLIFDQNLNPQTQAAKSQTDEQPPDRHAFFLTEFDKAFLTHAQIT